MKYWHKYARNQELVLRQFLEHLGFLQSYEAADFKEICKVPNHIDYILFSRDDMISITNFDIYEYKLSYRDSFEKNRNVSVIKNGVKFDDILSYFQKVREKVLNCLSSCETALKFYYDENEKKYIIKETEELDNAVYVRKMLINIGDNLYTINSGLRNFFKPGTVANWDEISNNGLHPVKQNFYDEKSRLECLQIYVKNKCLKLEEYLKALGFEKVLNEDINSNIPLYLDHVRLSYEYLKFMIDFMTDSKKYRPFFDKKIDKLYGNLAFESLTSCFQKVRKNIFQCFFSCASKLIDRKEVEDDEILDLNEACEEWADIGNDLYMINNELSNYFNKNQEIPKKDDAHVFEGKEKQLLRKYIFEFNNLG